MFPSLSLFRFISRYSLRCDVKQDGQFISLAQFFFHAAVDVVVVLFICVLSPLNYPMMKHKNKMPEKRQTPTQRMNDRKKNNRTIYNETKLKSRTKDGRRARVSERKKNEENITNAHRQPMILNRVLIIRFGTCPNTVFVHRIA